jgi:FTR1 family protein
VFEAFVITLREGVEAALVLAIAVSLLRRRGLERLIRPLAAGAACALAGSVAVAILASRISYNEELAEGLAMLIGAALVLSLTWWMWKAAPRMSQEIEGGLTRATESGSGALGVFILSFGLVLREGVETAIFLSAAEFNSQGLGLWVGALAGLALAIVFAVLFMRGTLRVPLKPFFSLTSAVLLLIAIQLLIGGLHELSEGEFLPSSRVEMAVVGPLVKNELLLFTLTVAIASAWLLLAPAGADGRRGAGAAAASGPEARLERAAMARERSRRRWTGVVGLAVVAFLSVAFVQRSRIPDRPPAAPLPSVEGRVSVDPALLADGHAHFFQVAPESAATPPLRFFAIRAGDSYRACADACVICGDKGYYEDRGMLVCRNCTSPIAISSIGRSGGCNPVPLPSQLQGGALIVRLSDLVAAHQRTNGR